MGLWVFKGWDLRFRFHGVAVESRVEASYSGFSVQGLAVRDWRVQGLGSKALALELWGLEVSGLSYIRSFWGFGLALGFLAGRHASVSFGVQGFGCYSGFGVEGSCLLMESRDCTSNFSELLGIRLNQVCSRVSGIEFEV